jgi:hypothetical protein
VSNRTRQWPQIKQWLRVKGFNIGQTMTGWAAVNRTGIVIIVSQNRVKVEWPIPGDGMNERKAREATMPWMQWTISEAEQSIESIAREDDGHGKQAQEAAACNKQWRKSDGE